MAYPKVVEQVIEQFTRLPGIGRRSAERIVFWLMNRPVDDARIFVESVIRLKEQMHFCPECSNLTDEPLCSICNDDQRDRTLLCIVESPKDLMAIERTGVYKGMYHVLLGAMSPSEGRGPEDIALEPLKQRMMRLGTREVVIATDPDTEGEMTALYVISELRPLGVKLSRIGMGLPMGSSVEYVDHSTLMMSMNARREIGVN